MPKLGHAWACRRNACGKSSAAPWPNCARRCRNGSHPFEVSLSMESRTRIVSPDVLRGGAGERTPPGQKLSSKWPVLHYGSVPKVDPGSEDWRLRIFGLVENEYELSYDE